MNYLSVVAIFVSLIAGGAMGAVINTIVTNFRARKQPVYYAQEIIELFRHTPDFASLSANFLLSPANTDAAFPIHNLSVARIKITNSGNADIASFDFGLTCKGSSEAVKIVPFTPDRHHELKVLSEVAPDKAGSTVDFSAIPFNREDEYSMDVFFTYKDRPGKLLLSTSHPLRLVDRTVAEAQKAKDASTFVITNLKYVAGLVIILLVFIIFFRLWSDIQDRSLMQERRIEDQQDQIRMLSEVLSDRVRK